MSQIVVNFFDGWFLTSSKPFHFVADLITIRIQELLTEFLPALIMLEVCVLQVPPDSS